ncbi:MAG: hypothetical protein WC732_09795 [Candidatus Omnitrophota bacterium]
MYTSEFAIAYQTARTAVTVAHERLDALERPDVRVGTAQIEQAAIAVAVARAKVANMVQAADATAISRALTLRDRCDLATARLSRLRGVDGVCLLLPLRTASPPAESVGVFDPRSRPAIARSIRWVRTHRSALLLAAVVASFAAGTIILLTM